MTKNILSLGYSFPGGSVKNCSLKSDKSLFDGDIILFMPSFSEYSIEGKYTDGKLIITRDDSNKLRNDIRRWSSELYQVFNYGKTIFIFLSKYEEVYIYSDRYAFAGDSIDLVNNYDFIPINLGRVVPNSGSEIISPKGLNILSSYWNLVKNFSSYKLLIENKNFEPILTTKYGNKVVGTIIQGEKGTLLLLPPIENPKEFIKNTKSGETWTEESVKFGESLSHILFGIDTSLHSGRNLTPPPPWTNKEEFKLVQELVIRSEIEKISKEILSLEEKKKLLKDNLKEEGSLRYLLYETGKPLENAVIKSLRILGFNAERYKDDDLEVDVISNSNEGIFLGEVVGKDYSIDVEKLRQLLDGVSNYSEKKDLEIRIKGVIFGNAYRHTEIEEREDFFTEKCYISAKREKFALVKTTNLFSVAKYLLENDDPNYAERCRKAILETEGEIVNFPNPYSGLM